MAYDNKDIPFVFPESSTIKMSPLRVGGFIFPSVYIEDIESNTFYLYPKVTDYYEYSRHG